MRLGITVGWAALLAGCVIGQRPVVAPDGDEPAILLLTCQLRDPLRDIARHAWFAVRDKGESQWERIETGYCGSGPVGGIGDVILHEVWRGEGVSKKIACLRAHEDRYQPRDRYLPWPGPNSNTFVAQLLRRCGLRADLPATAIGKDFDGPVSASWTTGGTGFQIETPLIGFRLGLTEGVQIHLMAFEIGIDWWPPAIIVPIGSGRIGFDDR